MLIRESYYEDLLKINVRKEQKELLPYLNSPSHYKQYCISFIMLPITRTFIIHDTVLACMGVNPLNNVTAEVIGIFNEHIEALIKLIEFKNVMKECRDFTNSIPYKRLQMIVRSDFKKAQRFAEFFGFKKEAEFKNYYEDADAFLYVKIKE